MIRRHLSALGKASLRVGCLAAGIVSGGTSDAFARSVAEAVRPFVADGTVPGVIVASRVDGCDFIESVGLDAKTSIAFSREFAEDFRALHGVDPVAASAERNMWRNVYKRLCLTDFAARADGTLAMSAADFLKFYRVLAEDGQTLRRRPLVTPKRLADFRPRFPTDLRGDGFFFRANAAERWTQFVYAPWTNRTDGVARAWRALSAALDEQVKDERRRSLSRTLVADRPYLRLAVNPANPSREVEIRVDGRAVRSFVVPLAASESQAAWFATLDLARWRGKPFEVFVKEAPHRVGDLTQSAFRLADEHWTPDDLYDEPLRGQIRFSPRIGWMNDPNGLSYRNGEWHLFFQYDPFAVSGCVNAHWGHAVSKDLVHWTQREIALYPGKLGVMFSGGGIVDTEGRAGFGKNEHLLYFFGRETHSVGLAHSSDGVTYETWPSDAAPEPLLKDVGDPQVFFHEPTQRFVLLANRGKDGRHGIGIWNSTDGRNWEMTDHYLGGRGDDKDFWLFECPGLVELKIAGETNTAWVCWGGGTRYAVGAFDGRRYTPWEERIESIANADVQSHVNPWADPYYADQVFTGAPGGRKILLPWMHVPTGRGSRRFNQQMGVAQELSLVRTKEGLRLVRTPVPELQSLRCGPARSAAEFEGEMAEVFVEAKMGQKGTLDLDLRGVRLAYDAAKGLLACSGEQTNCGGDVYNRPETALWPLEDGRLSLHAYLDRVGLEVFSGDGRRVAVFCSALPNPKSRRISVISSIAAEDVDVRAYPLASVWKTNPTIGVE